MCRIFVCNLIDCIVHCKYRALDHGGIAIIQIREHSKSDSWEWERVIPRPNFFPVARVTNLKPKPQSNHFPVVSPQYGIQ